MQRSIVYEYFHDKANVVTAVCTTPGPVPLHFHRCLEILYQRQGNTEAEVQGETFLLQKDEIVFVGRCQAHTFRYDAAHEGIALVIGMRYSDDFYRLFHSQTLPAKLSDAAFNRELLPLFEAIAKRGELKRGDDLVVKGLVNVIIGKLLERYSLHPLQNSSDISLAVNALNYIDEHYKEPLTLSGLAAKFGYNKYYFSRLFNACVGENLNAYLSMVRLRNLLGEAKQSENPNLSRLALDYGFESFSSFYRACYRYYGCSPKTLLKGARG